METMKNNSTDLKLSILLVTYNHEKYLEQALDGLFNQRFDGLAEIVIADDVSNDRTLEIVKGYEKKNNQFSFKYLKNENNLGITKNYQRGFEACSGEYVAVLEGDDYWISPHKLQRQIDFLDEHWECDLCSANYFVYEENRHHFYPRVPIADKYRLVSARELIADNLVGNFSTCMYRKSALKALPQKLFTLCSYDWIVNICVAQKSMIGFLQEPLSVYRLHSNGVWTQIPQVEKLVKQLELIPGYDDLTGNVYHDEFQNLADHLQNMITKSTITNIVSVVTKPTVGFLTHVVECLPPVALSLIRAIVPPKLKRFIVRLFYKGAV